MSPPTASNRPRLLVGFAAAALASCSGALPGPAPGPERAESVVAAFTAHTDEQFGVPSFLWLSPLPAWGGVAARGPVAAAQAVLRDLAPRYRLDEAAQKSVFARRVHDLGEGAIVVEFGQRVDGAELFPQRWTITLDRALRPLAAAGLLVPPLQPRDGRVARLDSAAAVARAFTARTGEAAPRVGAAGSDEGGYLLHEVASATAGPTRWLAVTPARARRVQFVRPAGLEPAWYVELDLGRADETESLARALVLSAVDGAVLFDHDLTASDAYTYRVWADDASPFAPWDGPQGNAPTPHPTGKADGYQPPLLPSRLVTLQNSPFSRNDPWLPANATQALGNNVFAYSDLVAPDGFGNGDLPLPLSRAAAFDRPYDTSQSPTVSNEARQAAATQLFYVLNYMHDFFYDSGFDEAAGNPQQDNYGRGGLGNDRLHAEAQDYSGRNNANAQTPADGKSPRIQMYLFDGYAGRGVIVPQPAGPPVTLRADVATFGPSTFSQQAALVLVDDGAAPNGDGCQAKFVNAAAVAGKIALIDRGTCTFGEKAVNAQAAGAIGVIIVNNVGGAPPVLNGQPPQPVNIPQLSISDLDGATLKKQLPRGPVTVTMYRATGVARDGAIDSAIVSHEWGHVLSSRLVGDGGGLSNQQAQGMGEGWSDFVALLTVIRPEDALAPANNKFSGVYATASYVRAGGANGGDNQGYYFGLRRVPYSIDFTKDPLTFKHIQNGEPLPGNVPLGQGAPTNAEVHNTGEVWATMLWECYVALLQDSGRLSFAEATKRMKRYLVASLKMTPLSPTFVEARDAVLAVALGSDAADYRLFWLAFARRGIGMGAVAPPRQAMDNRGVVESFVVGNDLVIVDLKLDDSVASCDRDGVLDNGETGRLTVTIRNTGLTQIAATKATFATRTPGLTLLAASANFPATPPFQTAQATIDVKLAGAAPLAPADIDVVVSDPTLLNMKTVSGKLSTVLNHDSVAAAATSDAVDSPTTTWSTAYDPYLGIVEPWRRVVTAGNGRWFIPDFGAPSDHYLVSPPLRVKAQGDFSFSFLHRYSFETSDADYDGGLIELSRDGGATWSDLGAAAKPGYTGRIGPANMPPFSPITGRNAFTKASPGYPAFTPCVVSLGAAYRGETVRVRFRVGTDEAAGGPGWEIDNFAFQNLEGAPFAVRVADRGLCKNHPPIASAGPDRTVDEGALVTLAGSGSDADNDPLTYRWVQTAGPVIGLSNDAIAAPTFTAPAVPKGDFTLGFALVVNDRTVDSAASPVKLLVRRAAAMADGAMVADAGAPADLTGIDPGPDLAPPEADLAATEEDLAAPSSDLATGRRDLAQSDLAAVAPDLGPRLSLGGGGLSCAVGGHARPGALPCLAALVLLARLRRRR